MAYGLLLYKEIEAPEGLHRLEVWKDGYAGDAIEIDGLVRDSIHISKNAGDACDAITTSVLTFALYDTGQLDYSQFFTPNAVLFKVVWKMNGSARWTGYLTPDSYSENLSYRDTITLTARDNLGRLNDYDFNLARGQMMTVRSLIVQGLTVAGVAMDTVFVTTKVASSPDTTLAIDGLVNTSLLVGSTWHEALTLLLEGLGLTLSWNDGNKFEVRDITQAPSASQSAFFISKSGFRQIRPAWKNLTASQDYGLRDNFYEGQFSAADCGSGETFTPTDGSPWEKTGTFNLLNPYKGAPYPSETIFVPIAGGNETQNNIAYRVVVPATDTAVKLSLKVNNTAWIYRHIAGPNGNTGLDYTNLLKLSDPTSYWTGYGTYYLRFRCDIILHANNKFYFLRENWVEFGTSVISPYLYFIMPTLYNEPLNPAIQGTRISETLPNVDMDNEVSIYLGAIPYAGELLFVVYEAAAQYQEDDDPWPQAVWEENGVQRPAYLKISDIKMAVEEGIEGRANLITINEAHNVQSAFGASIGQVPNQRGNALLYLGGLFYDDDVYTPLTGFKRDANGDSYDLLELVAREHITHNNAAYNALSGTMKAEDAFRFDRAIDFEGTDYRIIAASLAVLSNTLSVQFLQQEADFADADYAITEVDSEGNASSSRGGTGGIAQGSVPATNQENILVLTEGLAKAYARITSLEDWLRDPAFDELPLDTLNVARCINLGGMAMEYDAENGAWHLLGNLYADGWVSAGGVNSEGGGGGGGIDLGAMWTSLRNTPTQTSEVTANTKIALAHLPYTAGAGVSISNAGAISIAESGIEPGTYTKVTVDAYGRVTAGEAEAEDNMDVVFAEGIANLYARVSSLEDWLRNPSLDDLYVQSLGAGTVDTAGMLTVGGTANIAGLLTASGEVKITGSSKRLWFGDGIYLELDSNGYIHTNGAFYADSFISAGGLGSGGSGGGLDLGAMWTSLCNTAIPTSAVDANTKIAVAHLPIATASTRGVASFSTGLAISSAGAVTLATSGVTAGTYTTVTVDAYGRVTSGSNEQTSDVELAFAEGIATVSARVGSLENWLRDPWLDTLQVADLCAATATVTRIYIGDAYFEYDADGYLHTNAPLYSDEWISAGGVEAGGGSGSVDLGAVWTSLCNEPIATADITPTTKIALSHIPISAGDGIAISNAGAVSLALSGVAAGTYAAVTVDAYGRVTSGSAPAALTFGSKSYDGTQAVTLTAADLGALTASSIGTLTLNGASGSAVLTWNPANGNASLTLTKAVVGLSNVENTKLSTWAGSSYLTTVGTITSGTWHGSAIGNAYLEYSSIGIAGTAVSLGGNITASQVRSLLSISNVENTALSTWGGSTYINTVGTITTGTWNGSRISNSYLVHSKVTIAGVDVSLGGSIADYTLLSALGLTSAASDIATLSTYFTDGIANQATRLSGSYTRSAWGQTFWSNGQPASISGAMTGVDSINGFLYITNSNGRLGVGTSQPSSTLHVAGGAYITSSIITDSYIYIGGTSAYIRNDGGYLRTNVGFAADGFISAGGVASSSDARLKKNLKDIALTVHDIAAAPAVSFEWVDDRGSSAGSIAQYWQTLLPDNVRAWEVDGFLSMEYGNIALLAAITIARAVETQEQKIARLEARVQELENQLLN